MSVRVRYALWAIGLLAITSCSRPPEPDVSRTDIVWVTVCTLRADHLGTYGYGQATSPWLDALAARSVVFERVLAAAPWTRPAIAAMTTGIHPRSLGVVGPAESLQLALPQAVDTLAERLSAAGYATLAVVANPNVDAAFGFDQGFRSFQAHDVAFSHMRPGQKLDAARASDALLAQVAALGDGERFFGQLVLVDAHKPYEPRVAEERLGDTRFSGATADYDLQIRYVDDVLQSFFAALEAQGRDDLLVVVTADHGEAFDEHPGDRGHGFSLYNATIWVPWILAHPSLSPVRVRGRVEALDIPATLLELLDLPTDGMRDAHSSVAAARGAPLPPRGAAVTETELMGARLGARLEDGWKLIVDRSESPPTRQLYRYVEDPLEREDLAAAEPDRVARMAAELARWQADRDREAPRQRVLVEPPPGMRARLEALGYVTP